MIRYKKIIPYILVLGIGLVFLIVKPAFSPAKKGLLDGSGLILRIINFPLKEFKKILTYHSTYNQNQTLKKESAALKSGLVDLEELKRENSRFRRLFNFKQETSYSLVAAKVIGKDPSSWFSSLIVDKGRNDGIRPDMAVVTESGLAGKVVEAGNSASKIMLINDPVSSVAALVQRSREQGVVSGTITGACILHFLPAGSDVKISDIVITSGLGEVYPKGLIIGRVVSIADDSTGLAKVCVVEPTVKLSTLEEILIKR